MLRFVRNNKIWHATKQQRRLMRLKRRVSVSVQGSAKAKVIIVNLNHDPLGTGGKVVPRTFFPPFCAVLAKCGIASVYLNDTESMADEIIRSEGIPTVVINLVHEIYDDRDRYNIPLHLIQKITAIFNSYQTAGIIGDKKKANKYLSNHGVLMPNPNIHPGKKIFSNACIGTNEEVFLYDSADEMDDSRYNTEFIDTKIKFGARKYYTTIRLVCIGSNIVKIYCRASDVENCNPSVHNIDTPRDRDLMDYIRDQLILPNMQQYNSIAEKIEAALGPGFYVHDLLNDQKRVLNFTIMSIQTT